MEKQILSGLIVILLALSGWTMHTVVNLQLEVRSLQSTNVAQSDINDIKLAIQRLQILLQEDALLK